MSPNFHPNGGLLLKDLPRPDFHAYAVSVPSPGAISIGSTRAMAMFLRDVMQLDRDAKAFACSARTKTTPTAAQSLDSSASRSGVGDRMRRFKPDTGSRRT
jgi:xylulose-5-phosphate/fructose-6-phosphate phosphoketolase